MFFSCISTMLSCSVNKELDGSTTQIVLSFKKMSIGQNRDMHDKYNQQSNWFHKINSLKIAIRNGLHSFSKWQFF